MSDYLMVCLLVGNEIDFKKAAAAMIIVSTGRFWT